MHPRPWLGGPLPLTRSSSPNAVPCHRLTGLEESAWGDEEEAEGHNYYNSIPGKEPPPGGLMDSRLALTQPCGLSALGQVSLRPSVHVGWAGPDWGAGLPCS